MARENVHTKASFLQILLESEDLKFQFELDSVDEKGSPLSQIY